MTSLQLPKPEVSVVIPAYNAERMIASPLKCLAEQDAPPSFEVIVVDNGSTDATREAALEWAGRLNLRVISAPDEQGPAYARNVGAIAARGEILAFCDADDFMSKEWLRTLSARATAGSIVAGPILKVDADHPLWSTPVAQSALANSDPDYKYMGFLPCVLSGSMAVTRQDYMRIGGFDNSYGRGCEDVDFSWRAQLAGLEVAIAHGSILYYTPRETSRERLQQGRGFARAGILLWLRYREHPVSGKSFKWSVAELARTMTGLPGVVWSGSREGRMAWMGRLGGAIGSLEGHIRFRVGRPPQPRRLEAREEYLDSA